MDRTVLQHHLEHGLSLEQIGALVGLDPSTVGYWAKKHGLTAVGRERHAPKGGIPRQRLEELVSEGLSTRQIAAVVGLSQSTVRHWLRQYGLKTARAGRKATRGARDEDPPRRMLECTRHGHTQFWLEGRGIYRCLRCRSDAVSRRRRRVKETLVRESGGRCALCGYDRYVGALHFHHREAGSKIFGLAERGFTRSLDAARSEAAKCVLLCSNCHAEVEASLVNID